MPHYGVFYPCGPTPSVIAPWSPRDAGRTLDGEDFALTKKHRLDRAGFSASRSFVATARVPQRFGYTLHSVLAVPAEGDWWILNNWHHHLERAGSLERWWDWQFIRPRYDMYLFSTRNRRPARYGQLTP